MERAGPRALLDTSALEDDRGTYYGAAWVALARVIAAWVALARVMLQTHWLDRCGGTGAS